MAPWTYIPIFFSDSIDFKKHIFNLRSVNNDDENTHPSAWGGNFHTHYSRQVFPWWVILFFVVSMINSMPKTKNEFSRAEKLTNYLTFWMNSANQMRLFDLNIVFWTKNILFNTKMLSEDARVKILCFGYIIYSKI